MGALEKLNQDKLPTVIETRDQAKQAWLELENEFNKLDPARK